MAVPIPDVPSFIIIMPEPALRTLFMFVAGWTVAGSIVGPNAVKHAFGGVGSLPFLSQLPEPFSAYACA